MQPPFEESIASTEEFGTLMHEKNFCGQKILKEIFSPGKPMQRYPRTNFRRGAGGVMGGGSGGEEERRSGGEEERRSGGEEERKDVQSHDDERGGRRARVRKAGIRHT
jgi:hypothetical protein